MIDRQHINEQLQRFANMGDARAACAHKLVIALVLASVASGLATYAALTRSPFFGNDPTTIMILSLLDLGFLVLLGTIVTQRILYDMDNAAAQSGRIDACMCGWSAFSRFWPSRLPCWWRCSRRFLLFRRRSLVFHPCAYVAE